ncbi:T9SS type B sorting domain-containing protein [Flavobacterium sp. HJJ]|uniref:T9SS type B sorting domain-containing protein n=1 Tax=Flavobacterium sp. HJJ TaxID=2783792 RepID=UPI00188CC9DC|nr:choice-of-anchor L domain-containing protein [Flavobacterium sp. HJJ]MBF4472445.1 T9SS type B sorting domain-containing protein [Flavobacterium sp. HJJ]
MNPPKLLATAILLFSLSFANAQVITVDDTKTAQQLIENVLVNSSCANVSGFNASGNTFTPGQKSYGYFNAGNSNFPLKEGVLLSTFNSKTAIGPYVSNQIGGGNKSWAGDADLDRILGIKSINATVVEFDFVPLTNFISFNYIFASNEYQSYFPCEFSDGFAFLIKEKGSTDDYKNIAVIPGTAVPVSSKNIHPVINSVIDSQNITHPGCNSINETYFNGFNNTASPVNYSGQTIKLNAQTEVTAGKIYHIKLVIADDGPEYYDSSVFLEAGSFSAKMDLGPDRTAASSSPICFGENYLLDTKLSPSYTFEWYKDSSPIPIPGETKPSLTVTDTGTYKVKVTLSPSVCTAEDEVRVEYAPQIVLNDATLYRCDPDGDALSVSDITAADNIIKNNDPKLTKLVYYKSLLDAQNETNPIPNPAVYSSSVATETLYARVSNAFGCTKYALLNIVLPNNPISTQNPIESCDTDNSQDGMTQFNLNVQITPQLMNGLPQGLTAEYYLTQNDAVLRKNQLPNLFTNTIPYQQTIYARILNGPGDCYGITPETLIINTFDPPNFQDLTTGLCDGSSKDLTVDSGFSSYLWNTGSTANTINVTAAGEYTVTVTNSRGCQKTKKFIVKPSGIATITDVKVNNFSDAENMVTIHYIGNGNFEFSLDGNFYQDSPIFNGLEAGIYWAAARDKNGCGTSASYKVYIIDYPRFFTPNNDGYNDIWKIKNLDILPKSALTIFDRYGKLIKQLDETGNGWNGTYNGKELPADDYWFAINFADGKTMKGHFSLKR